MRKVKSNIHLQALLQKIDLSSKVQISFWPNELSQEKLCWHGKTQSKHAQNNRYGCSMARRTSGGGRGGYTLGKNQKERGQETSIGTRHNGLIIALVSVLQWLNFNIT